MTLTAASRAHLRDLTVLVGMSQADLDKLWKQIVDVEMARELLLDVLPQLVAVYGAAAATLAADFYDDLRDAEQVRGRFRAIPAELPDQGRTEALARWGVAPLLGAAPDLASAKTLVSGGLQRIVANASRQTIAGSSIADPAALGWKRVGVGSSCSFCSLLLSRGAVYREATAEFRSHDHCNCTSAPEWRT